MARRTGELSSQRTLTWTDQVRYAVVLFEIAPFRSSEVRLKSGGSAAPRSIKRDLAQTEVSEKRGPERQLLKASRRSKSVEETVEIYTATHHHVCNYYCLKCCKHFNMGTNVLWLGPPLRSWTFVPCSPLWSKRSHSKCPINVQKNR